MSPRIGATTALLPRLRVVLRVWFAEAWDMHPHQVPHFQCCPPGWVHDCTGVCTLEVWVGDDFCHANLECYCEEKVSRPCGGKPPVPFCLARWARCQHPYSRAGEPQQGREVMHCVGGVFCRPLNNTPHPSRPARDHYNHYPSRIHHHAGASHPLLRKSTHSVSGGIVHPAGRCITPSTPNSECIAGMVTPSLCPRNVATSLPFLCLEACGMHPYQVPHGQCCPSGSLHDCTGGCTWNSWVGDEKCDAELECYCEEKSDCGEPPLLRCSARLACCQHPHTGAGEQLPAHLVIHGAGCVVCGS